MTQGFLDLGLESVIPHWHRKLRRGPNGVNIFFRQSGRKKLPVSATTLIR